MSAALWIELVFVQKDANYTVEASAPRADVQARALGALHESFGENRVQLWRAKTH